MFGLGPLPTVIPTSGGADWVGAVVAAGIVIVGAPLVWAGSRLSARKRPEVRAALEAEERKAA